MNPTPLSLLQLRGLLFIVLVTVLFLLAYGLLVPPDGPLLRAGERYIASLNRRLRRLVRPAWGEAIAWTQGGLVVALVLVRGFLVFPFGIFLALLAAVTFLPSYWLERERQRRVMALDQQVDGFVTALANALKTTPSVGDALLSVESLVEPPLRTELEQTNKHVRLGSPLDQALVDMAQRSESRPLETALSAILLGRQVGGNLPGVLEKTAQSLREMARLEGVVRTRTAEGRMQMWVMGAFPFLIVLGLDQASPGYFRPLTESPVGLGLVGLACLCWLSSLFLAHKILAVDL